MKLKITCYTPKDKAEKCIRSFGMKYFSGVKKPLESKIVSHNEFYYIYEYKNEKDMYKAIHKKIPKAEHAIRSFYLTLIHLIERANKIGKAGAWTIEKVRRWIMKRMRKKGFEQREMEDFIDAVSLEDKDYMIEFLGNKLFEWEILEEGK